MGTLFRNTSNRTVKRPGAAPRWGAEAGKVGEGNNSTKRGEKWGGREGQEILYRGRFGVTGELSPAEGASGRPRRQWQKGPAEREKTDDSLRAGKSVTKAGKL